MSTSDAYRDLSALLDAAGLAEHALFLNWGYQSPDEKTTSPGEAQRQLILQLLGDRQLDGLHVLDVGCGRGGAAALLVEKWRPLSVTGVDLSSSNIHFCRQRHRQPRLRFQLADACQLPQADGSIDLLLNVESSGAYPDIAAFFRQVWRVLKAGGEFFYADIFDLETLEHTRQALETMGFVLVSDRSVSREVMAARRSAGYKVIDRLQTALPSGGQDIAGLRNYFALPGTPVYQAMASGQADYHYFHWRKPVVNDPARALPTALCHALEQRNQRLENVVKGTGESSEAFPLGKPAHEAALNLFALPYAGGGATIYREWGQSSLWPADWRFCALQLAGRENRIDETPHRRMESLVAELARQIEPYTHRPWALLGCSLGCKVAFELARYFTRLNRPPCQLFLMACPAPSVPLSQRISECSDASFNNEVRRLGGTPEDVLLDPEMMKTVGKALRADCALAENYQAAVSVKVSVPTMLVLAEDDALVPVVNMLRWQHHLTAEVQIRRVSGGHFFLRLQRETLEEWLIGMLKKRLSSPPPSASRWFPFGLPDKAAGLPVFCFHHAGGNAASWREWRELAKPSGLQLCPVELPGRASRFTESPRTDLPALIDELEAVLAPFCQRPFALLGHSLGCLLAFELAQRLPAGNLRGIFVSGRRPPDKPTPEPLRHLLSDDQLAEELQGLEGTPDDILQHAELVSLFLPALRADFCLTERYQWDRVPRDLRLPLHAFCGDDDAEVSVEVMKEWLNWGDGRGQLHVYPGGHFYLQRHREAILRTLAARVNL